MIFISVEITAKQPIVGLALRASSKGLGRVGTFKLSLATLEDNCAQFECEEKLVFINPVRNCASFNNCTVAEPCSLTVTWLPDSDYDRRKIVNFE